MFFLYKDDDIRLFAIGNGAFRIKKKGFGSYCGTSNESFFDYNGVDDVLIGKCGWEDDDKFVIKRVVVFQFE